jgi:YNFM family putative membrane transporter
MGLLAQAASWRVALGALGVLDLAAAALFVALLPTPRRARRPAALSLAAHLAAWGGHLARPPLLMLFAVAFLAMGAFVTVYNYVGFRLAQPPYALTPGQIGLVFLCYLVGMVASSWAGGLADRYGRAPVLVAGALIGLAGLALTLAQPLAAVIGGVAALTAGFFVAHSVASGWVGRLATGARSHASALYLLAYYAGGSVLGSAGGLVWRSFGWPGVTAACAAAMLAVLALGLALGRSAANA